MNMIRILNEKGLSIAQGDILLAIDPTDAHYLAGVIEGYQAGGHREHPLLQELIEALLSGDIFELADGHEPRG